jgi:5'-nucleotidase/UDP-sugar diphosphatase
MFRRFDSNLKGFSIFCFCAFGADAKGVETTLTIFTINDVYEITPHQGYGGIAELMTLLKEERLHAEHYLTTVNGDFLSPSLISGIFQGSQMIDLMNMIEVDVVVFGNHEFDYGVKTLINRMQESQFCWLGTNVLTFQKELPLNKAQGSVLFDIDGIKVGMIGLCTPETNTLVNDLQEVTLTPTVLSAQAAVHKLKKEGVDVIVALTHHNFEEDLLLAIQVPEIDVILGGHDHEVMTWYNGKTLVHKSGHDAEFLARIDLNIEKKEAGGKTKVSIHPKWKLIPNYGYPPDPLVGARVAYYADQVNVELAEEIAECQTSLDSTSVRSHETTMGNIIADALKLRMNADVAILNGGGIRGNRIYQPGTKLTKHDIQTELPFGDIGVLVEVSGEQLLKTLEYSLSKIDVKSGIFPQVSGIKIIYEADRVFGDRVCEGMIDGKPIEKQKIYRLATNDFLLRGGDGNLGLKQAKIVVGPGVGPLLTAVVIDYLKKTEFVIAKLEGRILDSSLRGGFKEVDVTGPRIHFN